MHPATIAALSLLLVGHFGVIRNAEAEFPGSQEDLNNSEQSENSGTLTRGLRCDKHARYRTYDGSCNNLRNIKWGMAQTPFERLLPPAYEKGGRNAIRQTGVGGVPLPSSRKVSTTVHKLSNETDLSVKLTTMHMLWGQFIDHDITLTPMTSARKCCGKNKKHKDCIPIRIPADDSYWSNEGTKCMELRRSEGVRLCKKRHFMREQINNITSYLDAGAVYGSSTEKARELREFEGGQMRTSSDGLPHARPGTTCNIPEQSHEKRCFAAGDARATVWPSLTSIHDLFVQEHNRIADKFYQRILEEKPEELESIADEIAYQNARRIIGAMLQVVTIDFLTKTVGPEAMARYDLLLGGTHVYRPDVNPSVTNVFATAAFRFGHGQIPFGTAPKREDFTTNFSKFLPFSDMFNQPDALINNGGCVPFLTSAVVEPALGMTGSGKFSAACAGSPVKVAIPAGEPNLNWIACPAVRDELFAKSFKGKGLDLPAVNAQRGRDHGIPPYNNWRKFCGLEPVTFEQMPDHSDILKSSFAQVYNHPDDIDLFPAAVSERPLSNAAVGPTFACLIGIQFQKLKFGDRFWYESQWSYPSAFSSEQIAQLSNMTLAEILCRNSNFTTVPRDVFVVDSPAVPCDSLNSLDLNSWQIL